MCPVLVDVSLPTYRWDAIQLEVALGERTRAIIFGYTLGYVCNLNAVVCFAKKHSLWVIERVTGRLRLWCVEDSCDALGSTDRGQAVGTFCNGQLLSSAPHHNHAGVCR